MSIFFKDFGPYSKLRTANGPIAWRKQTQPYNNHRYPLSSSLTFAVNTSSCYTCVNNLGPVQVLEPPCCGKALTFSNSGKLSIKTRQRNLVAVTQRNVITRTIIFEAMITSFCFADSYKNTNKCLNISENIG